MKMRGVRFTDEQWDSLCKIASELNSISVKESITPSTVIRMAVDMFIDEYKD